MNTFFSFDLFIYQNVCSFILLSESRAIINDLDVILHFLYYKSFIPRFSELNCGINTTCYVTLMMHKCVYLHLYVIVLILFLKENNI